jgi:FPC/CPF motif-containing protein YcgG
MSIYQPISIEQAEQSLAWAREIAELLEERGATNDQLIAAYAMATSATFIALAEEVGEMDKNRDIFVKLLDHFTEHMTNELINSLVEERKV